MIQKTEKNQSEKNSKTSQIKPKTDRSRNGVRVRFSWQRLRRSSGGYIGRTQHPRSQIQRRQDHGPRFSQTHRR